MQVSSSPLSLPRSSLALPTSRFPRMSLTPTHHHPSASTRILARVFPYNYNLKFLSPSFSPLHPPRHLTRPALSIRARFDSASNRASSKSLMEDDAELSDWVSELRMTPAFTDGRDGPESRPKKRGRDANLTSSNSNGFRDRDMNKIGNNGSNFEHRSRGRGRGRGANHLTRVSGSRRFQSEFEQDGDKFGMHTRGGAVRGGMRGRRDFGSRGGGRVTGNTDKQERGVDSSRREKTVSGFMDLIGEQTSDVDGETQEIEVTNRSSLFQRKDNEESISSPGGTDSYLTETSFDQFAVSPSSLRAIKDAGYVKMTVVQEATLPFILKGKDVLAKAKTGTGKTVAFMLPSIEVVVKSPSDSYTRRPPILVLVICPTRELANQAAAEAKTLLKYHSSIGVQVVIGGTNLSAEQKHMKANPCQILVATPGRLKDHIENTTGFATRLMGLKVLVLDEADHLLDMGFRKDIEKIISAVPKQRQTLLFSATVPEEVQQISHIALKRDHEFINTVEEGAEDTHSQVRQMHLVAPMENHFPLLYIMLKEHISDDVNYKVGMMLRGMGFDNNTSIYVASGKIYKAEKYMAPLKQMFPLLETKDTLASPEELAPFEGHSSRLAALDYTICLYSEVFVTTQGGNFPHFLMGHRRYMNGGHAKTIIPDKRKLALIFDNPDMRWEAFQHQMQEMLRRSDIKGTEIKKASGSLYTFPMPDCMCKDGGEDIESGNTF